jgi:hypothetical protein
VAGVDHAGGVDLAGHERPDGLALATDVVAVQPDPHVEPLCLEPCGAGRPQVGEGDQGRLG